MVLSPKTREEYEFLLAFMKEQDVHLSRSEDLRMIAHGTWEHPRRVNAVVAYNGFFGKTACIHVASDGQRWMDRSFLYVAFHFPFVVCGLAAIIGAVPGNREKALRLNRHLGFKEIAVIEDGWDPGIPLHLLKMTKDTCRWLKLATLGASNEQIKRVVQAVG